MEPKQLAIIYARVSTKDQEESGVSLDAQIARASAYCIAQDYEIVDTILDGGHSGKTLDRPGLQKSLEKLEAKQATILVFYKLDRLTRSIHDLGVILDRMSDCGFEIASVSDSLDTSTATGRLQLNIMISLAQWEREVIVERTKEALRHKKADGQKTGGSRPYGFSIEEKDGKKVLVPDRHEQKLISLVESLRDGGMSLPAICKELRRRKFKNQSGNTTWHPTTIARLLKKERAKAE